MFFDHIKNGRRRRNQLKDNNDSRSLHFLLAVDTSDERPIAINICNRERERYRSRMDQRRERQLIDKERKEGRDGLEQIHAQVLGFVKIKY